MNKRSMQALVAFAAFASIPAARADYITDWNLTAETATVATGGPPFRNRAMSIVQVAVHDALNSIDARYDTYLSVPRARAGASPEAAAAAANLRTLSSLVPAQVPALTLVYNARIAAIAPCPAAYPSCIEDGIDAGNTAADAIIAARTGDGSATPHRPYNLPPGPGVYQPTPPQNAAPQFAGWAEVTPFAMNFAAQFRADPVPMMDVTSPEYTRDFNEVKSMGDPGAEARGDRSADQSAVARFWPGGGANFNLVARTIVADRGLDAWQHARLFALLNMGLHDSTVAVFETKFHYNFWRPATAIRNADIDGNPDTSPDPAWVSYQTTPPYPDFTCGLTTNTGAALEVLRRYFETDEVPYSVTAAGMTRSFATLSQAGAEAIDARVFGGMHFRTGCVHGLRHGGQAGRFVFQHELRPVRGRAGY
jgi:hypothetical protein